VSGTREDREFRKSPHLEGVVGKSVGIRGPTFGTGLYGSGGLANDIPIPGIYETGKETCRILSRRRGELAIAFPKGRPEA